MNIIQYKGKLFVFPKNKDAEPNKIYKERLWFIVKNIDKSNYEHICHLSYLWMNNKYYNLEYPPNIMEELQNYQI